VPVDVVYFLETAEDGNTWIPKSIEDFKIKFFHFIFFSFFFIIFKINPVIKCFS
jgi:hypothetical protein